MRSAYEILGVPGNADAQEITEAFQRASKYYAPERLADNPDLGEKLIEIKQAFQVLSSPDMRKAHDRKLNQVVAARPRPHSPVVVAEEFGLGRLLMILAAVAVALFAIGAHMSHTREQARAAQAAEELAIKKIEAEVAAQQAQERELAQQYRERQDKLAEDKERRLRAEGLASATMSSIIQTQQQAIAQRQANIEKNEERQKNADAERKLAEYRRIMSTPVIVRRW